MKRDTTTKAQNLPQSPKILIRLPNWLGDAVMSTPALELLKSHFSKARFCLVAPSGVLEVFRGDERVEVFIPDESKKSKCRVLATKALANRVISDFGVPDIALTLTNHFYSALFLRFTKARFRVGYKRAFGSVLLNKSVPKPRNIHQVLSYANLARCVIDLPDFGFCDIKTLESITPNLKLHLVKEAKIPSEFLEIFCDKTCDKDATKKSNQKIIGLNPAAAYGSAKRWLPSYFAEVASYFALRGGVVVIFGTKGDYELGEQIRTQAQNLAQDIAQKVAQDFGTDFVKKSNVKEGIQEKSTQQDSVQKNILNLCGKTDIQGLMRAISKLGVFITNDSGPMHIACALGVPTIALFGPTKSSETNGFRAKDFTLLQKEVPCAPCKKRECPLPKGEGHHKCMVDLLPSLVIDEANKILEKYAKS